MDLKTQKRLASKILKCGLQRVKFDSNNVKEIKEAITRADIRGLIIDGAIAKQQVVGTSNAHANLVRTQKRKGRQRSHGSRKGRAGARLEAKSNWINRIRRQRLFLKTLLSHSLIEKPVFNMLYCKSKGGFFRSRRHIQLYLEEHSLVIKKETK